MNREIKISFVDDDLERGYISLSDSDRIKKKINRVMDQIKINLIFGEPISKRLIGFRNI